MLRERYSGTYMYREGERVLHTCTEGEREREWYIHVLRGEGVVHTCTEGGREWYIHVLRGGESGTYMY